ncbi:MAG: polysaccharide deacetylase family protein [Methanobrevibacter sp.]|nr:polysaccharide deacetylase family protein [Methanobrevibacter sp.]MDO5860149.1 polysaccharide deacetylase family protein [Methanobrevibacter sp.]
MILLSFDIEEFDVPREHGVDYPLEEGMKVSAEGTNTILNILRKHNVKATFFCTVNFAQNAPEIMEKIISEGHEVASHGVDHFNPKETDFAKSKEILEEITNTRIAGYRQPRMFPVKDEEIKRVGYVYNSSLNPAFIPGRYMNLNTPRTYFKKDGVIQIPASVTPLLRFPLFWLSLHNLPEKAYHMLVRRTLKRDGYFTTYFHPWEFYELKDHPEFKIPFIIKRNSGRKMAERLDNLIEMLEGHRFVTYSEFIESTF